MVILRDRVRTFVSIYVRTYVCKANTDQYNHAYLCRVTDV